MAVKPNLALIPSGVKASKLYSVLPSDGVGDFDFSRSGSATRINKDGLIETVDSNVPRLNYPLIDGVVSGCPSLLLEPERRNLVQYSEDIESWGTSGVITKQNNVSISPDGTLNAGTITSNASNFDRITQTISVSANSTYTGSLFIKKVQSQTNYMGIGFIFTGGTTDVGYVIFDAVNGIAVSADARIDVISEVKDFGDYWNLQSTATDNGGNTSLQFNIYATLSTNGTTTGLGISSPRTIWGLQLEQGSYATSYIPTNGSQVTRSAETCNNAGDANTFNDSEGVLMAEISAFAETGRISLNDGTTNNNVRLVYDATNVIYAILFNGTNQAFLTYTLPIEGGFNKIAFKYKASDFALWIDGIEVDSQVGSGTTFTSVTLSELDFDAGNGLVPFYGSAKQIQYFDKALNNTDLEELTSWTSFNEMATAQLYTIE